MEWITAVIVTAVFATMFLVMANGKDAADYQRACARHGGIQQIVGFNVSVKNSTTVVVCKDGTVTHA